MIDTANTESLVRKRRDMVRDENIVEGLRNKDEACLKEIISTYSKLAYSIIYRIIGDIDPQVVEELTSDTFFDLWRKAEKIDLNRGSLKNLVCLVARSKALNRRKLLWKGQCTLLSENEEEKGADPEAQMLEEENVQELLGTIRGLKEPASRIFIMRYLYLYSITEIADKLGMKRSQVDNYLSRGRKRLSEDLGGVQYNE